MKIFIKKVLLFMTILLVINLVLYAFIMSDEVYAPFNNLMAEAVEKKPTVVLMGDSHSERVKQRHLGDAVFNLAADSDSYGDIYLKLNYCIKKGVPLKKVILPCDFHAFSVYRWENNNKRKTILLSSYDDFKEVFNVKNPLIFWKQKYAETYLPMLNTKNSKFVMLAGVFKLKGIINPEAKAEDIREWAALTDSDQLKSRQARLSKQFKEVYQQELLDGLVKIKTLCDKNGIDLIGLRFPLEPAYLKMIQEKDLSKVHAAFESVNIPIKDHVSLFKEDEWFSDQDHVSVKGAGALAKEIINLAKE